MSTEDPAYRTGESYPATGPCSMASPCPGPDAPRDQHGAGCPLGVEATLRELGISPTPPLTPEALAELRRLLDECQPGRVVVNDLRPTHNAIWLDSRYDSDDGWERLRTLAEIDTETETLEVLWGLDDAVLIAAAINALPALLDAAAERDALAARLEGAEAVIEVQDVHARLVIAERDEAMRALGKLTAERDAEPDRIAELTAERDALAEWRDYSEAEIDSLKAMLADRCLADITHRDEEHRQSVCMLPVGHAPLAHDDCMGCTWTDAEHWELSAVDRMVDELARIADESRHEDWDSPRVQSIVGRIRRALDGEADR